MKTEMKLKFNEGICCACEQKKILNYQVCFRKKEYERFFRKKLKKEDYLCYNCYGIFYYNTIKLKKHMQKVEKMQQEKFCSVCKKYKKSKWYNAHYRLDEYTKFFKMNLSKEDKICKYCYLKYRKFEKERDDVYLIFTPSSSDVCIVDLNKNPESDAE